MNVVPPLEIRNFSASLDAFQLRKIAYSGYLEPGITGAGRGFGNGLEKAAKELAIMNHVIV